MSVLLETRDLKKHFKTGGAMLHAVDGISLTLDEGRTLGIVGESGCGKSTLGRVILGLLPATDGQVLYRGEDITAARGRRRKPLRQKMQIIFQDPYASLNPRHSIGRIIGEPMLVNKKAENRIQCRDRVLELMETVGLAARLYNT